MSARAILLISIIFAAGPVVAEPIGMRAKGGHPEYLFLEKAPRAEAQDTARRPPSRRWASGRSTGTWNPSD